MEPQPSKCILTCFFLHSYYQIQNQSLSFRYGWVVVINLFVRELSGNILGAILHDKPAVNLGLMAILYGALLCGLSWFQPYESNFVSNQESFLTSCLGVLCWAGAMYTLMSENKNTHLFATHMMMLLILIQIVVVSH